MCLAKGGMVREIKVEVHSKDLDPKHVHRLVLEG